MTTPKRSRIRRILPIASVFTRLVVATIAGVAAYVFGQLFAMGIFRVSPGLMTNPGAVGVIFYIISPVVIASIASALTFHLLSPRPVPRWLPFRYTVARYERGTCLGVTVPLFCGLLFVAPFVLEAAASRIWGSNYIASVGSSETFNLILLLGLSFLFSYLAARVVYERLRWRQVASADPLCPTCLYNLTANTSGICPECGKQITAQQMKTPNRPDRENSDDTLETIP